MGKAGGISILNIAGHISQLKIRAAMLHMKTTTGIFQIINVAGIHCFKNVGTLSSNVMKKSCDPRNCGFSRKGDFMNSRSFKFPKLVRFTL